MAKTNGTFTYPMSSEKDIVDAGSNYDNISSEFTTGTAFRDVTVNPVLKTTHVTSETTTSNITSVSSAIFTEIRKGPHISSICNDSLSGIGNRILPVNTTLSDYGVASDSSPPYRIRVYDLESSGETNRKFTYSTIDSPATDTLGIDIDNYDYFIMINPEIIQDTSSTTQTSIRPHFAKITGITTFDEFGDGLEFSPKYPVPIPKGTKFEVFKGPHKVNDTDVVAISYGLRGDANASTDNYDVVNFVSKPTFYFYNDRLEQDNQLDYMEKYTLTRMRWFSTLTDITVTDTDGHNQYQEGSSIVRFEALNSTFTNKLCEGMSIFNSSGVFLGNIKDITGNYFQLDFARIAIVADTSNNQTYKIGKGIQNVVFRTEARVKGTIPNKARQKLDVILVDNLRTTDNGDSNFNPSIWQKAFPNMKRHEQDSNTVTTTNAHGEMNGPSRYITSDTRPFSNDKISPMSDIIVNNPRNRMSKIAKMIALNNSGMLPYKIERGKKLKVLNTVFSDKATMKTLHSVLASKTSGANTITFTEISAAHDYKLSDKLPTNSIIKIGDYYYVVDSFGNKNGTSQILTTKAWKTLTDTSFTVNTTVHTFTNEKISVAFWTGVLNTEDFDSETDVIYADNKRLSVSNSTVEKKNTKFYNSRITFNSLSQHENLVDYIDRNMEYVKIQDADRQFYQSSNIQRFYYYDNSYSLQEEVFSGIVESTENRTEHGLSTMTIEGRDDSSALLNKLVNRNLIHTEDLMYSTLNPVVPLPTTYINLDISGVEDKVITHAANSNFNPTKYMLLFKRTTVADENGTFIGEVASSTSTSVTLSHKPLVDISTVANTHIYTYDPFVDATYVSGVKAIASNPALVSSTDFEGVSDKGVVLQDSFSINRENGTLSTSNLQGTSNSGSYYSNRSLGYDIAKPISINLLNDNVSTPDSTFAFKTVNESGVSVQSTNLLSYSSEAFDVVQLTTKDNGGATLEIAPRCPLVMARLENNASDTRTDYSFYFVNTNINSGGFLHRLDTMDGDTGNRDFLTHDALWTPRETYRYWDVQKFPNGTIKRNGGGIYNNNAQQKLSAYSILYPIKGNGNTPSTTTLTSSPNPIFGSNMVDENYTLVNASDSPFSDVTGVTGIVPPHEIAFSANTSTKNLMSSTGLLNYDGKAQNYELFATGDLFPYSKLRYNNITNQQLNFDGLSCLLESDGDYSDSITTHSSYDGVTNMVSKKDINYETTSIKSASKTTNEIKRFGIARLVEATFDWHFNPVDSDTMGTPDELTNDFAGYQMHKARENVDTLRLTSSGALTWNGGSPLTFAKGDCIFDATNGNMLRMIKSTNSFTLTTNGTISSSQAWSIRNVTSDTPAYIIKEYTQNSNLAYTYPTTAFEDAIVGSSETETDMSSVFLIRPNFKNDKFRYGLLKDASGDAYNPPNVFIPFALKASAATGTNPVTNVLINQSPFLPDDTWNSDLNNRPYYHSSRVIAGLLQEVKNTSNLLKQDKYGLEEDVHPYENCVAVFRNIRQMGSNGLSVPDNMFQTSSLLGTRQSRSDYEDYNSGSFTTPNDFDQPTTNTIVWIDGAGYSIIGTHTRTAVPHPSDNTVTDYGTTYFMDSKEGNDIDTTDSSSLRVQNHVDVATNNGGGVYKAQMLIKPHINTADVNTTHSNNVITIDLDDVDSAHSWMQYTPNLTGYYLVSERGFETKTVTSLGQDDVTPNDFSSIHNSKNMNIGFMAKIISHTHNQTSISDTSIIHTLTLDRDLPNNRGPILRLMKLAETTFRDTPKELILNRLHDTGLDYSETTHNFRTGVKKKLTSTDNYYQTEGVYSAYVLLNLDVAPNSSGTVQSVIPATHVESYDNIPFVNGDTFDCYITDGVNSQRKTLSVSNLTANSLESRRKDEFKLTYDGTLTGNGVVSFGEVINIELDRKPDLDNPTVCHIGTSLIIGSEVETEIERIAKEAGMTTDTTQTQSVFTGNIVLSVSNNVITCKNSIQNISDGDVIYTHEGLPIGKVNGVSGSTITIDNVHDDADIDLWYTPLVNDELIIKDKKTFIATNNFTEVSAFDAINTLAGKKEMDFNVKNNHIDFRKYSVDSNLTKKKINYKNNRIFTIDTNVALFAKANKVTVVGDRIKATAQIDEEGTEITFVDSTIRTKQGALVKANELLQLHSEDTRKITLKLEKKGLEILEAGDIVELDFPAQSIPAGKYVIFEIENVLTSQITMTVGTFNKTIAERLSEIGISQRQNISTTFSKNSIAITGETLLKDSLNVRVSNVMYTISGTGAVSNVGFGAKVGFFDDGASEDAMAEMSSAGTEVGFSRQSVGVITQYDSED